MPQNYRVSTKQLSTYRRCGEIVITNPLQGAANVSFREQEVRVEGDRTEARVIELLDMAFDPQADIVLLDPATGEPTGQTMKQAQVYQALFSAYMALAKARDEREQDAGETPDSEA